MIADLNVIYELKSVRLMYLIKADKSVFDGTRQAIFTKQNRIFLNLIYFIPVEKVSSLWDK
jgi:hypothetical protein